MSESPPEFPVLGHQLPPAGSDSADPHRAPRTYGRIPWRSPEYPFSPVSSEVGEHPASGGTEHSASDVPEHCFFDCALNL